MGLLGDHTETAGLGWGLPVQSNVYSTPYSLTRHNQLRAVLAAGLDAVVGRGVVVGGVVTASGGLVVQVASGTIFFVGGLAWELTVAVNFGGLIDATTNYVWGTIRRLQTADYTDRTGVDTYELALAGTLADAPPNLTEDWFQLAVVTTAGGAVTDISEPADLSKKYSRSMAHQQAPVLDHLDGSVTPVKLSFDPATQAELDAHQTAATIDHPDASVTAIKLAEAVRDAVGGVPALTAGAEAGDAIAVTVQAKDLADQDLAERRLCRVWLADTDHGPPTATMPDGGVATTAGVALQALAASQLGHYLTTVAGVLTLTLTESTAKSFWLMAETGDGRVTSLQVTFA